ATLHTNSCAQTMNRIIDVLPPHQQSQVRAQLSMVLEGVLSQQLIPRANAKGRVLASEIMVANPAVRALLRDNKIHQIYSVIQTSAKLGMKTMNQALTELHQGGLITYEIALNYSPDPDDLKRNLLKSN
ncbi:MAG: type IV pili twitching motility protein PilT, partial [Planctomycetota bacterium]